MAAAPDTSSPLRVALAGAGRVGIAVASLLKARGHEIVGVWSRSPESAERAARRLRTTPVASAVAVVEQAQLVLVGAVDDAIATVAGELVEGLSPGATVVHFAGAHGIEVLDAVSAARAERAALHPVQSVPDVEIGIERLPGSAWGITTSPAAEAWARSFVTNDLQGVPVTVAEGDRALWHAAAVMTSNGIAALMSTGASLLAGIGVSDPQSVLGPLAAGTVANVRSMRGAGDAFTGPVVRGDHTTIERHLAALRSRFPELVDEYALAGRAIVAGAARTARIDDVTAGSMRDLLESA
jgi:predicted short-subunit dehydrogenase-like oxidoreductase (DUF2520 family)